MRQNGSGVIINWIALDHALEMHAAAYAATMYGLIALTKAASAELAPHGVFVHAVGRGIPEFQDAEPSIPHDLGGAILSLCGSRRSGQIVNVEAL
jgi:NAD(P)-dependent dehydrogenase (short-subunit alcohol dehydrogenase family)